MKRINGLSAAVAAVVVLVASSAFADWRNQNETSRDRNRGGQSDRGGYRDNDRVTLEGKVRSFERRNDGYQVYLDRGNYSFFVPEQHLRNRRDFRVGVSIRLGGVFRGGSIFVDAVDFPGGGGYGGGYYDSRAENFLRGTVERIDFRRDTIVLRDQETGRFVTVDMRGADRRERSVDLEDLRRGDFVSLSGDWSRGGVFSAYRVESVNSGRGRRY
jgi:hypothetical protein